MRLRPGALALLLLGSCGTSQPDHAPERPEHPRSASQEPGTPETRPAEESAASRPAAVPEAGSRAFRLPTGLGLALQTDPGRPAAHLALALNPSPLAGPPWMAALACRGLVRGGSVRLPAESFLAEVERLGGRLETRWRMGAVLLELECPPAALDGCLALLLELILFPAYQEEALEAALAAGEAQIGDRPAWASLAGDGPAPVEDLPARPEELPSAGRMRRWHSAAFHPEASQAALISPLPEPRTLECLARTLALWQVESPPQGARPVEAEPGLYWTDAPQDAQAAVTVLVPLGSPWEEAWPARRVLGRLLAGLGARGRLPRMLGRAGLGLRPLEVRWQPWPGGAVALAASLGGLEPGQVAPALAAIAEALRESASSEPDPLELAAACAGAVCEESLALRDPGPALERGLLLAAQNRFPVVERALELPLEGLGRVGPRQLAGGGGAFRPERARVHVYAPAQLRSDPSFSDARLLPGPAGRTARGSAPAAAPSPEEQARGRELLALAVGALGGEKVLAGLRRLALSGRVQWHLGPEIPEEWRLEIGRLQRTRTILGVAVTDVLAEGQEGRSACGEESALLPPDAALQLRRDLEGNPAWLLARFDRREGPVAAAGSEEWEGITLELVRLGPPGPEAPVLAIDPLSGLPRILHRGRARDLFFDYREAGELRLPHRIERWRRGERLWVLTVDSVRLED